jgi:DNA-directed RNA polymerase specialized sigma24 family protein
LLTRLLVAVRPAASDLAIPIRRWYSNATAMGDPLNPLARPPTAGAQFTTTHWTVVMAAGNEASPLAAEALEKLCRMYWYPLYAYIRRQGRSPHDAEDLTQGFFASFLKKNSFGTVTREQGRFRSFLLASLNHYLSNERDRLNAAKRGGGTQLVSWDATSAEERYRLEPMADLTPEKDFDRNWAFAVMEQALNRLHDEFENAGKARQFEALKVFLTQETTDGAYDAIAAGWNLPAGSVAVAVHRLRQRYRDLVLEEVADTVATPSDIEDEMRALFAALREA